MVDEAPSGREVTTLDRRRFMKYTFNAAGGVIAMASLGAVGFASFLMGQATMDAGDAGVKYWVPSGAEDTVWYGNMHLEVMKKSHLVSQAATSDTGNAFGPKRDLTITLEGVDYTPEDFIARYAGVLDKYRTVTN